MIYVIWLPFRRSNGAPVYQSANPKAYSPFLVGEPVFLYRYREGFGEGGGAHGGSGRLIWLIGVTWQDKPQDVNDPDSSASEKHYGALFDSSPSSAEGDCAHNPASPSCTWRECNGYGNCYPYPMTGYGYDTSWYGDSASLKVVAKGGGGGGH